MAFGNISTFYLPTAANAGASQWGSDVPKLLDAADAGNDTTTKTNHSTGGAVTRTLDPYTTSTADLTQADYGWAVTPTDMNSVTGARRFIPAGNHVLTIRTASSTAMLTAEATYTMYVYRVSNAAGSRARTLIGSASGAAFNYGAVANTYRTETVTVTLAEIILEADETIQYSVEQACAGTVITGRINTHDTGTQDGVAIRVDHPGLKVLADGAATITGDAVVLGVTGKVLGANGVITGAADILAVAGTTWSSSGTLTGSAVVAGALSSVFSVSGTITGSAVVEGKPSIVLGAAFTIDTGGGGGTTVHPVFGHFE